MKFKNLASVGLAAILTVSGATVANSQQPVAKKQPATTSQLKKPVNVAQANSFVAAEHPTQGNVSLVTVGGKKYLQFSQNFKTESGPDLFVILYSGNTPPTSGIKKQDYVSIGRLKKVNGTQRYAIPAGVKLDDYQSVAIWCRKFNATFGYAPLPGSTTKVASNSAMSARTQSATPTALAAAPSGTFVAGEHPTAGAVSVVTKNNKRFLMFGKDFKTDEGPDLYVILHRSDAPPVSGIKEGDYVTVARLQNVKGTQSYALPDGVNLEDYRSVAIWCRKFNATFGYAALK